MSLAAFQSALARLVTDPVFREDVRTGGTGLAGGDFTPRAPRRRRTGAGDPGLLVTATLIRSFRLGKVLTLLPLTRTLLGDARLGQEVRRFWSQEPPRSFYALEEALAFCDHLLRQGWWNPFLEEVVAFERALLELRRVRPAPAAPPPQQVRFRHDPRVVLGSLAEGRRPPRRLAQRPCLVQAALGTAGQVEWSMPRAVSS
jgi:hypothetical protein